MSQLLNQGKQTLLDLCVHLNRTFLAADSDSVSNASNLKNETELVFTSSLFPTNTQASNSSTDYLLKYSDDSKSLKTPHNTGVAEPASSSLARSLIDEGAAYLNAADLSDNMKVYLSQLCQNYESAIKTDSKSLSIQTSQIIKHIYPIILLFGILGNLLSFFVMVRVSKHRKNFRKFSVSLAALSIADICVLAFGCAREYIEVMSGLPLKSSSNFSCKFFLFTCYLSVSFSAYLHVFIACERWIAIKDPIKAKFIFSFKTNKVIIAIIFLICVLINLPLLWFSAIKPTLAIDYTGRLGIITQNECDVAHDNYILNSIILFIDSVFYCLIPYIVTILLSLLSLVALIKSQSQLSKGTGSTGCQDNQTLRPGAASCNSSINGGLNNHHHHRSIKNSKLYRDGGGSLKVKNDELNTSNNSLTVVNFASSLFESGGKSKKRKFKLTADDSPSIDSSGGDGKKQDAATKPVLVDEQLIECSSTVIIKTCSVSAQRLGQSSELGRNSGLKSNSKSKTSNLRSTFMLMSLPLSYLILTFPILLTIILGWIMKISADESQDQDLQAAGQTLNDGGQTDLDSSGGDMSYHHQPSAGSSVSSLTIEKFNMIHCIASILMYLNCSISILFYILIGKGLRNDFVKVLSFFGTFKCFNLDQEVKNATSVFVGSAANMNRANTHLSINEDNRSINNSVRGIKHSTSMHNYI